MVNRKQQPQSRRILDLIDLGRLYHLTVSPGSNIISDFTGLSILTCNVQQLESCVVLEIVLGHTNNNLIQLSF